MSVAGAPTLSRRLLPLQIGVALQGLILWVPIEKLFMTEIGFDAASVGAMAAAYAAVVPLLEVPSGILADRWSRSWVLVLACLALLVSSLIGGLSHNVITYVIAAMALGFYFACSSGTVDSVVYDTVVEETGSNELYEKWIGRTRAVESAAFMLSALAGGLLAQYTSERFTYFATVPLVGLAVIGFLRFKEPRLHQAADPASLRSHIALTSKTLITSRIVLRVLLLAATAGLLSQAIFEFGPLWLVALAAPAELYGPYWATLVSTLGVGGLLIGKLNLQRRLLLAILIILSSPCRGWWPDRRSRKTRSDGRGWSIGSIARAFCRSASGVGVMLARHACLWRTAHRDRQLGYVLFLPVIKIMLTMSTQNR